jgi:hypothetical protein
MKLKCADGKCRHKHSDRLKLYGEALVVGAALVPMYFAVSRATSATRIDFVGKEVLDVFLSGFLFHLLAEESGVNEWYLTNSHAAKKIYSSTIDTKKNGNPLHTTLDWSGACGITRRY